MCASCSASSRRKALGVFGNGLNSETCGNAGDTKTVAGNRVVPLLSPFPGFAKSQKRLATLLKPHGVTVHSLRKTYAYTLKSSQIHVTTAAKMMGHSNPLVTLKIYTLVLDDEIAKSAIAMEAFIVKSSLDNQAKRFAS